MSKKYDKDSIQVLKGLDAVRKRPGMYIGSTSSKGLHHLIWEILDNSIDEFLAGYGKEIDITLHKDDSITVLDRGRGIPVENKPGYDKSTLELVLTTLHAGGKFNNDNYVFSGGLHGVGLSVVNALSKALQVNVCRDGKEYEQYYAYGKPTSNLVQIGSYTKKPKYSTKIKFTPDNSIFETTKFDNVTIENRLKELTFLNSGLKINFYNEKTNNNKSFSYKNGLLEYINEITKKDQLHKPITVSYCGELNEKPVEAEVSFVYRNKSSNEDIVSFVNNVKTIDGGTHVTGFKTNFTRIINDIAKTNNILKEKDGSFQGNDIREGLTCVISIKLSNPQFESQTKSKLGSTEGTVLLSNVVNDLIKPLLEQDTNTTNQILNKILLTKKARDAAKRARDNVINKSSNGLDTSLPGKLASCSGRNPEENELFICEGNSAGGSAKQCRDQRHQAILLIKGKILNTEKATIDKIMSNEEIRSLVMSFGTSIGKDFDLSKLRYHKIIIMTDADVDGQHIRTLLLTFFFRYMEELIVNGHIYVANPPLYRLTQGNKQYYALNDEEYNKIIKKFESQNKQYKIQRYKGLGEMNPDQLWETTMDPKKRILHRVTMSDKEATERTFDMLMGNDASLRKKFIDDNQHKINSVELS